MDDTSICYGNIHHCQVLDLLRDRSKRFFPKLETAQIQVTKASQVAKPNDIFVGYPRPLGHVGSHPQHRTVRIGIDTLPAHQIDQSQDGGEAIIPLVAKNFEEQSVDVGHHLS